MPTTPSPSPAQSPVLLVHGIWNQRLWLLPLARRLRGEGFEVRTWGYPSVLGGSGRAAQALAARLRDGPPVDLVGHSLGGLVALEALRIAPDLPVGRVVCLGSPLRGSGTARALGARRWSSPILGRSADLLTRGLERWDGAAEVGVVAGCVPRGLGRLIAAVDLESDGTVGIAETRLPGVRDPLPLARVKLKSSSQWVRMSGRSFSVTCSCRATVAVESTTFLPRYLARGNVPST